MVRWALDGVAHAVEDGPGVEVGFGQSETTSTCQRSWYLAMTSVAGITVTGTLVDRRANRSSARRMSTVSASMAPG